MASNKALDNESGDIYLLNGQRARVYGVDQTRQLIANRLKHFYGDWFLKKSSGVTYFQDIFTRPINLPRAELILIQVINETAGVSDITSFAINFDSSSRLMLVDFSVVTVQGEEITESGVVINE